MSQEEPPTKRARTEPQGKSWCYTAYDYEDVLRLTENLPVEAHVCGEETCPTTGKTHWQGYIRFKTNKRLAWWKKVCPRVHVEIRKGTESAAAEYCRKENNVKIDFGVRDDPIVTDGESEEDIVVKKILCGVPMGVIMRDHWKIVHYKGFRIRPTYQLVKDLMRDGTFEKPPDV